MSRPAARRPAPFHPRLEPLEERIALNAAPTLSLAGLYLQGVEGWLISTALSASDPDGDSLTYSASGMPAGATLNATTGLLTGVVGLIDLPAPYHSWFTCTFAVSDGNGGADAQTVTWGVSPFYMLETAWYGSEGTTASFAIPATTLPSGSHGLTFSASGLPQGVSLVGTTLSGIIGYANAASGTTATLSTTVTATDGVGGVETGVVTWIIEDTNRLPIPPGQMHFVGEAAALDMHGTDNTGTNSLTYSASNLPIGLTINPGTGMIGTAVASTAVATGSAAVHNPMVILSDDHGGTDTRTFYWGISNPTYSWSQSWAPAPLTTYSLDLQSTDEGDSVSVSLAVAPGSTPTFTALNLPPGLSIDGSGVISGQVSYDADESVDGTYDVTVVVDNGSGVSYLLNFDWEINDVLELTNPGNQSSASGDEVSLQVVGGDPGDDSVFFDAMGLPEGLSIDQETGLIEGVIAPSEWGTTHAVTVFVEDGLDTTRSVSFSWVVGGGVNHAPALDDEELDDLSSSAGDEVYLSLPAGDNDGDVLTYTATGLPEGLSIDPATGEVQGTIANGAASGTPHTVTLVASDGQAVTSTTFLWTVHAVGLGDPGDQSDVVGDSVSMSLTGSQAGTASLTYTASGLPAGLTLDASTGLITGTLTAAAASTVTLTLEDGSDSVNRTLTWTVARLALAGPGLQQGQEGGTVSLQLQGTDVGGTLTYSATGLPAGLSLNASTGLITGTLGPSAHWASPYRVTVTAADGEHSDSETFVWTVRPKVALLSPGTQRHATGDSVSLALTAGSSGGTLTYTASGLPAGVSINASTGLITGTLTSSATSAVTVTASDGAAQNSAVFSWSVVPLLLPQIGSRVNLDADSVSLALNARYHGTGTLAYSASGLPTGLSLNASTGLIVGTLDYDEEQEGPYAVTAVATAGTHTVSQVFAWYAQPRVVTYPIAHQSAVGGDTISLDVSAAGAVATATLTYSVAGLPSGLSLNTSTGLITGTIATSAVSPTPATVTLTASDGVATASQTFHWSVAAVGIAAAWLHSSVRNQSVSLALQGRAADGGTLTYSVTGLPVGLSLNASTGLISGAAATVGAYQVGVTVSQGASSASRTFEYYVLEAGLAHPGDQSGREGDVVSLSLSGASGSAASLTYSASGLPTGLSLDSSTGLITGTLAAGAAEAGPFWVVVAVDDGTAASYQEFTWDLSPYVEVDEIDDQADVEGDTVSLAVAATDFGSLSLSYTASDLPTGLSINASTGLISGTVTSGAALLGPRDVTVTVSDGTYSGTRYFWWSLTPSVAPAAPVVTAPALQSHQGGDVVSLQVQATDAAGYSLRYSASGLPSGLWLDPETGLIGGTLAADAASATPYDVTVTVDDGVGVSASATFSWLVNAAPVTAEMVGEGEGGGGGGGGGQGAGVGFTATAGEDTGPITVATFSTTDPGSSEWDFEAIIDWGDGTSGAGWVSAGEDGGFEVLGAHTYEEAGTYDVTVQITNSASGGGATVTGTAEVLHARWELVGAFRQGVLEDAEGGLVGVIHAHASLDKEDFTVLVDLGVEGLDDIYVEPTHLGGGLWGIVLDYVYAVQGVYNVEISVTGPGEVEQESASKVVVGVAYAEMDAKLTVAQFGVPDPSCSGAPYSATIDWGDGTEEESASLGGSGGILTVWGNHTYANDSYFKPGYAYLVKVKLWKDGVVLRTLIQPTVVVQTPVQVQGAGMSADENGVVSGETAGAFQAVTGADDEEDFAATVYWGDKGSNGEIQSSAGTINGGGGSFTVAGTHDYEAAGLYKTWVALSQRWSDGLVRAAAGTGVAVFAALQAAPAPTVTLSYSSGTPQVGLYGAYMWPIEWKLSPIPPNFKGGLIIQKITHTYDIVAAETITITKGGVPYTYKKGMTQVPPTGVTGFTTTSYYEAWIVDREGKISGKASAAATFSGAAQRKALEDDGLKLDDPKDYHDFIASGAVNRLSYSIPGPLRNKTKGSHTIDATAVFVPGLTEASLKKAAFKQGLVTAAGGLYSTPDTPIGRRAFDQLWPKNKNPFQATSGQVVRSMTIKWDATVNGGKGTLDLSSVVP